MSQAREIEVKYRIRDLAVLEAELHRRGVVLSRPVLRTTKRTPKAAGATA